MNEKLEKDEAYEKELNAATLKSEDLKPENRNKKQSLFIFDEKHDLNDLAQAAWGRFTEQPKPSFEEVLMKYQEWAFKTFDTSALDSFYGLLREVKELRDEYQNDTSTEDDKLFEFADCFFYLFYILGKSNLSVEKLLSAMMAKLNVNKLREWSKNGDGTFSHLK